VADAVYHRVLLVEELVHGTPDRIFSRLCEFGLIPIGPLLLVAAIWSV
jgi:hypothetical protein